MMAESCQEVLGEPMLFHIISSLKDNTEKVLNKTVVEAKVNTDSGEAHQIPISECICFCTEEN